MYPRRSLKLPITLAIVMIVLLIVLTVGWVLLTVPDSSSEQSPALYWTLLAVGTTFLALVLVGTVVYLALAIKAINLTRRQSNFIDSVTHELKSPIASLKLYLQTLAKHQVSEAERASFCRFMLEDVERLDHLINHVLDAARLEKDQLQRDVDNVELDQLLLECGQTICLRYRTTSDIIEFDLEPCTVRANRVDLEMIFRNLLDNAVKYSDSDPHVTVRLRQSEGGVMALISDNGRGIPNHLRRKIFGRFVRLGLELERQKPGTGLGLYIVRTLVRRLRGRIRVLEPEAGQGTVFEVFLPGKAMKKPPAASFGNNKHAQLHG